MSNARSNSRILIRELDNKSELTDDNLIIVEDNEDTKKTTIYELKHALSGDLHIPSNMKFYSSEKTYEMIMSLHREMAGKATAKEIKDIADRINAIITSNGSGKDSELVDARNNKSSLSERLNFDIDKANYKFLAKPLRNVTGKRVSIPGHNGYVDIDLVQEDESQPDVESPRRTSVLAIYSRNLLDPTTVVEIKNDRLGDVIVKQPDINGFKYVQNFKSIDASGAIFKGAIIIDIPLPMIYPSGHYDFYAGIQFSDDFIDRFGIQFIITYSDGTIESLPYNHEETYDFEAKKGFNKISFAYNRANMIDNANVTFCNIMLIESNTIEPTEYIPYERNIYFLEQGNRPLSFHMYDYYNKDYIYECILPGYKVSLTYYDTTVTIESVYNELKKIQSIINDPLDYCGLIEDYGTYLFLDDMYVNEYPDGVVLEDADVKFKRNGVSSKKITVTPDADTSRNTTLRIPFNQKVKVINDVGIFFYMNKNDITEFPSTTGGIKIKLCSNDIRIPDETHCFEYLITKKEMLQGWNFVKHKFSDFTVVGNPDRNNIQFIAIEIAKTDMMNGRSMIINSLVFNQKMKPHIMLAFNGFYNESTTWLYPFLATRGMKPTLFLNSKRSLSPEDVDCILRYKVMNGWDIGMDGCHPNKDILIHDDNFRNQYVALRESREWVRNNLTDNPKSYSPPFGNLRQINVPLLKDLGFNIAKAEADRYCGFFSKNDFAIPMHLMSNETTTDELIEKIDYAITSHQSICLYTNDVTVYGSDIDCTKVMLETIVDYINERQENNELECVTFQEFYERCTTTEILK